MEYLTKKFFVVQTPKINLMSPQTIFEPCKHIASLLAVTSCTFCNDSQASSFHSLHECKYLMIFLFKSFKNRLNIIKRFAAN